jgi:hypothetical protein
MVVYAAMTSVVTLPTGQLATVGAHDVMVCVFVVYTVLVVMGTVVACVVPLDHPAELVKEAVDAEEEEEVISDNVAVVGLSSHPPLRASRAF